MYKDFEELFERFSIMTVDGHLSDTEALYILKKQTSPELFDKLQQKLEKLSNDK